MSAEIKTFPGVEFIDQSAHEQPQADVIELLERLLEQAETGELQAIAVVTVMSDSVVACDYSTGNGPHMHTLVAGAVELQYILTRELYGPEESSGEEDAG